MGRQVRAGRGGQVGEALLDDGVARAVRRRSLGPCRGGPPPEGLPRSPRSAPGCRRCGRRARRCDRCAGASGCAPSAPALRAPTGRGPRPGSWCPAAGARRSWSPGRPARGRRGARRTSRRGPSRTRHRFRPRPRRRSCSRCPETSRRCRARRRGSRARWSGRRGCRSTSCPPPAAAPSGRHSGYYCRVRSSPCGPACSLEPAPGQVVGTEGGPGAGLGQPSGRTKPSSRLMPSASSARDAA